MTEVQEERKLPEVGSSLEGVLLEMSGFFSKVWSLWKSLWKGKWKKKLAKFVMFCEAI